MILAQLEHISDGNSGGTHTNNQGVRRHTQTNTQTKGIHWSTGAWNLEPLRPSLRQRPSQNKQQVFRESGIRMANGMTEADEALVSAGRSRQRDSAGRANSSVTSNNNNNKSDEDREAAHTKRNGAGSFYSKIIRQYLPLSSSFNLNHTPAPSPTRPRSESKSTESESGVCGRLLLASTGGRKTKLSQSRADADDDEKVNFAKESNKNNADGLLACGRGREPFQWPAADELKPRAGSREQQQQRQRLKVLQRPGRGNEHNNERRKIESSAVAGFGLKRRLANAFNGGKLTSRPDESCDSLGLFHTTASSRNDYDERPNRTSPRPDSTSGAWGQPRDHQESQLLIATKQRQCEQILEKRREELRQQLNKFKEQIQAEQLGADRAKFKRKSFLHLKCSEAPAFVQSANNLIRRKSERKLAAKQLTRRFNGSQQNSPLLITGDDEDDDDVAEEGHDSNNNNQKHVDHLDKWPRGGALSSSLERQQQQQQEEQQMKTTREAMKMDTTKERRQRPTPSVKSVASCSSSVSWLVMMAAWLILLMGLSQFVLCQQLQPAGAFSRSQPGAFSPAAAPRGSLSPAQLPPQPPQQQQPLEPPSLQQQQQQPQQQQPPSPMPATGSLVANINCNKIRGHVTLTPNLQGGTTITTQIVAGPPGEVYQWSVHQFPIKPGAAMCSCSALILGSKLIDLSELHGNLPSEQEFSVQSSLGLFGAESPVGHSLMLRGLKTGMVACGTFLPTSRKSNYRAKFHTPLSGSITVFQTAFGTSFLSHLMYSNGTRRHSTHRFDILRSEEENILSTNSLLMNGGGGGGIGQPPANSHLIQHLEQREHENELQACRKLSTAAGQQQVGEPLFRNLSYQLSISTENFGMRGRTSLVLPQIPFETFSSVYVVIYSEFDPSEPIACAPLRFVKPKTAAAKFQAVSVQGQIVFQQDSPYDVTVARVQLNFPNSDGHSYGIDELPMIIRRKSDTRVCPNIREIIYNPHHIEPSSVPPEGEATSDQYAVGDLSGKYGSLTGKSSEKITVNDHNLPLFGPVSIIGRALTIYSADGVAIACSNVELTSPMTTAFATFDFGIQGQFIFRQQMNDCNGDTYVYIEVSKPTSSGQPAASSQQQQSAVASLAGGANANGQHLHERSLDHNWHIHVNPVDSGLDHLSTTECAAAGPHFNPYNTSTSSIYSRDCTPFNVLRCELGDLSSKMFTIEIPPYKVKSGSQEPDIGKFFGTDIDLPLCGPASIVNRSVVVHVADFGLQRLACSTVIEFKPRN